MGSAIAYLVAVRTNATVHMFDLCAGALSKAQATVHGLGKKALEKGLITREEWALTKKRIHATTSKEAASQADLVIEAIVEDLGAKRDLFKRLDEICKDDAVFASNTSSLPITSLACATGRPAQFIGMHFFSPAHVMQLLEIIPGLDTSEETIDVVKQFGTRLGKTIVTSKDMPGFITTRLGLVLLNEAAFALMEGLSTAQQIDVAMKLGYNHPMGPLELADFIGLDVVLHIMEVLQDGFGDPKYRPCPLIRQLVTAGHLGRKSGRGFYKYGDCA